MFNRVLVLCSIDELCKENCLEALSGNCMFILLLFHRFHKFLVEELCQSKHIQVSLHFALPLPFLCVLCFKTGFVCSFGCLGTLPVDKAGREPRDLPVPVL